MDKNSIYVRAQRTVDYLIRKGVAKDYDELAEKLNCVPHVFTSMVFGRGIMQTVILERLAAIAPEISPEWLHGSTEHKPFKKGGMPPEHVDLFLLFY